MQTFNPLWTTYELWWSIQSHKNYQGMPLKWSWGVKSSSFGQRFLNKRVASTIENFMQHQTKDPCCKQAAFSLGTENVEYATDMVRLIVSVTPIGGSIQIIVPQALYHLFLYFLHQPVLADQPGQRKIYELSKREFYRTHMINDTYIAARNCSACARNGKYTKLKKENYSSSPRAALLSSS